MQRMSRMTLDEGLPSALQDAGALLTVLSYSRHQPTGHETAAARRAYQTLYHSMNRRQKLMLMLRRIV